MSVFSWTAPVISEEEERAELEALIEHQRIAVDNDLYGCVRRVQQHKGEDMSSSSCCSLQGQEGLLPCLAASSSYSRESIEEHVSIMKQALAEIPSRTRAAYTEVAALNPAVIDAESDYLSFLEMEGWDHQAAAKRMVSYWNIRKMAFGADKFCQSLTSLKEGALTDNKFLKDLQKGAFQLLPVDQSGRPILFFDRILLGSGVNLKRETLGQCLLYLVNQIYQREQQETRRNGQRRGFVLLINVKGFDLYKHFDRGVMKVLKQVLQNAPVYWRVTHMCSGIGAKAAVSLVLPTLKQMMGPSFRLRFRLHQGTDMQLQQALAEYGILKESLPVAVGGDCSLDDHVLWVKEQTWHEIDDDSTNSTLSFQSNPQDINSGIKHLISNE